MIRRRYIPHPHPFQQRQRWTGVCVRPDCGLPTEHEVHQHVLDIALAPIADVEEAQDEPEESEPAQPTPQLQLF